MPRHCSNSTITYCNGHDGVTVELWAAAAYATRTKAILHVTTQQEQLLLHPEETKVLIVLARTLCAVTLASRSNLGNMLEEAGESYKMILALSPSTASSYEPCKTLLLCLLLYSPQYMSMCLQLCFQQPILLL